MWGRGLVAEQSDVFGVELRRLRTAAGLSLATLAQQVHYSKGYLGKIETGLKQPGVDLARRCDAVLGAGGRLASLAGRPAPASPPAAVAADGDGEVWVMSMAPDGSSWMVPMPRREAIATGAASLLGLTLGAPRSASASAAHDGTLAAFRSLFAQVRQLGQTTSPSVVLPMVTVHTHTLRGMANGAPTPVRIRTGLTDLEYSEVTEGLAAGDSVLTLPSASLLQSQQEFRERVNRMTGGGALPGMRSQQSGTQSGAAGR